MKKLIIPLILLLSFGLKAQVVVVPLNTPSIDLFTDSTLINAGTFASPLGVDSILKMSSKYFSKHYTDSVAATIGGGGLTNGNKGDVTVSGSGTILKVPALDSLRPVLQNKFISWTATFNGFGTSILNGSNSSTADSSIGNRIATATGTTFNKVANSGATPINILNNVDSVDEAKNATRSAFFELGPNILGTSPSYNLVKYRDCQERLNASIAGHFLDTIRAIDAASITKTGTWSNLSVASLVSKSLLKSLGNPMKSSTTGDKLTFTSKGDNVVISYYTCDTSHTSGSFKVTIDGRLVVAQCTTVGKAVDYFYSVVQTFNYRRPAVLVIPNLSNGIHTVVIELLENKETAFDYIGHLGTPETRTGIVVAHILKSLAAGYALYGTGFTNDNVVDSANTYIDSVGKFWQHLNYPVAIARNNNYDSTTYFVGSDGLHPNDLGHRKYSQDVLRWIGSDANAPGVTGDVPMKGSGGFVVSPINISSNIAKFQQDINALNTFHIKNMNSGSAAGSAFQLESDGGSFYFYRGGTGNTSVGSNTVLQEVNGDIKLYVGISTLAQVIKNDGKIGFATNAPHGLGEWYSDQNSGAFVNYTNVNAGTAATIGQQFNNSSNSAYIYLGGAGHSTLANQLIIQNPGGDISLFSGSEILRAKNNGQIGTGGITSPTAWLHLPASTTSFASLRIPSGTAPTSPNAGDTWYDGTHLYFKPSGSAVDLLAGASPGTDTAEIHTNGLTATNSGTVKTVKLGGTLDNVQTNIVGSGTSTILSIGSGVGGSQIEKILLRGRLGVQIQTGWSDGAYGVFTSGTIITMTVDNNGNILFNPSSAASFTVNLPPTIGIVDGYVVRLTAGGTITTGAVVSSLTINPNSGQSIIQSSTPITMVAGDNIEYKFQASGQFWFRIR